MANKVNSDGMFLLEQPFARVPYENYRKIFRTSQKYIEKDFGTIQTTLVDLQETAGRPTLEVMRERFNHIAAVDGFQLTTCADFSRWAETRLDRWLVDWSLRHGKELTARQLAKEKHIETLVDIDLFTDIRRIEDALSRHSCTEALAWCNENKASLRKMKSTLEFELRLQEYIELARARKAMEAISYARKHLVPWQETHLSDILHANTLIAFDPSTTCAPYKRLYDPSRWNSLVQSFRLTAYSLNTLPTESMLHLALYAGLAALRLPTCFDPSTKNVDCPVCDSDAKDSSAHRGLGKLAEEVPQSHHANSTIVCRITGKIMDEDNMPMVLPNGQVYSREALEEIAARNNGIITCPKTGTKCEFSTLRKVFVS
ncbi:macrophage erythroblast attacher isoform 1 [Amanita rubescens]|nr:macrophage erythroblast attacher isoform 1 [Amanita rubescens]